MLAVTRLFFLINGRIAWFVGQRVFALPAARDVIAKAFALQAWWLLFVVTGYVFWNVLPLVALGFMAYHLYQFKHRDDWQRG